MRLTPWAFSEHPLDGAPLGELLGNLANDQWPNVEGFSKARVTPSSMPPTKAQSKFHCGFNHMTSHRRLEEKA